MADALEILKAAMPNAAKVLARMAAQGDLSARDRLLQAYPDSADEMIDRARRALKKEKQNAET